MFRVFWGVGVLGFRIWGFLFKGLGFRAWVLGFWFKVYRVLGSF